MVLWSLSFAMHAWLSSCAVPALGCKWESSSEPRTSLACTPTLGRVTTNLAVQLLKDCNSVSR
uniref:Secreted protein n=1 Tax=Physcomitrium patens TaxID=3218 RepID=A0A2K1J9L4_PHYPA|nr:hypothetical protein PHYPA_021329 [Physcomitrium patens]